MDAIFETIDVAALRLNVPVAWLKRMADTNQIPIVRAGRRRLFDIESVRVALLERARQIAKSPLAQTVEGGAPQ